MRAQSMLFAFAAVLVAGPVAAKDWLGVGQAGKTGDCLMEWHLQYPDGFAPRRFNDNPLADKLHNQQPCEDGTTCDWDGQANGSCQFKVGLCFCVDDHAIAGCGDPTPGSGSQVNAICGDSIHDRSGTPVLSMDWRWSRPTKVVKKTKPWERATGDLLHAVLASSPLADCVKEGNNYFTVLLHKPLQMSGETCTMTSPPEMPATCAPCTELTTIDVPLVLVPGLRYKPNTIQIKAGFIPPNIDPGRDKLNLQCLPNTTASTTVPVSTSTTTTVPGPSFAVCTTTTLP